MIRSKITIFNCDCQLLYHQYGYKLMISSHLTSPKGRGTILLVLYDNI